PAGPRSQDHRGAPLADGAAGSCADPRLAPARRTARGLAAPAARITRRRRPRRRTGRRRRAVPVRAVPRPRGLRRPPRPPPQRARLVRAGAVRLPLSRPGAAGVPPLPGLDALLRGPRRGGERVMTRLLVSVRTADEAEAALEGGAAL